MRQIVKVLVQEIDMVVGLLDKGSPFVRLSVYDERMDRIIIRFVAETMLYLNRLVSDLILR